VPMIAVMDWITSRIKSLSWLGWTYLGLIAWLAVLWVLQTCVCVPPNSAVFWSVLTASAVAIVGALITANRSLRSSEGLFTCLGGYGLALIIGLWTGNLWASVASGSWQDTAPQITQREIPVDGTAAIITGEIDFALYAALEQVLADNPDLQEVRLDSVGGAIHAARGLARLVRENGLNTSVQRDCFSACTLVFIAGQSRQLAPQAQLGFHSYAARLDTSTGKISLGSTDKEQARDRAAFTAAGVSDSFVAQMFDAPHEGLWKPSIEELRAAGVVTD